MAGKNREESRYLNIPEPIAEPTTAPTEPMEITEEVNFGRFRIVWQIATVMGQMGPEPKPQRKIKILTNIGEKVKEANNELTNIITTHVKNAGQRVKRAGKKIIADRPKTNPIQ